jgi:hypothetical protein
MGKELSMPIYIKYGSFSGAVANTGESDWIEIDSFQFGAARSVSSPTGGSSGKESSTPSVGEIVVTKPPRYSLTNVRIMNSVIRLQPSSSPQPTPARPRVGAPVPPWLKNILVELRPYMKPTGTIHLSGFQFDAKELSKFAGVRVLQLP